MLSSFIGAIVAFCCRYARWVALGTFVLGLAAGVYATRNFAMNSNSEMLISPNVPWRIRQAEFDRAFPQRNNLILVVVDGAPGVPPHDGPWQTTLLVRDEITTADADALARADLVLLQPLGPEAATLAGGALGLGGSAGWLSRIRPGMLAVVQPRRSLRWALLSPTPIERQLVGDRLP